MLENSEASSTLGALMAEAGENVARVFQEDWILSMAVALVSLESAAEGTLAIAAPASVSSVSRSSQCSADSGMCMDISPKAVELVNYAPQ